MSPPSPVSSLLAHAERLVWAAAAAATLAALLPLAEALPGGVLALAAWLAVLLLVACALLLRRVRRQAQHAEREQARAQAHFDGIVSSAMDAIVMVDAARRVRLCNPAAERMFGLRAAALLGQPVECLLPARLRDGHAALFAEFGHSGEGCRSLGRSRAISGLRANGEEFPIEATVARHEAGGATFFTAILRDVGAQRRTEEALRENQRLLLHFTENAGAGFAMFDRDMRYLAVSRRFLADNRMAGCDVIGRSLYEVFPEINESWRAMHRRCLAGESVRVEEDAFLRADGSRQWVRWEISPWFAASGEIGGIVLYNEDITARKEAETALHAAKAEAERANNAKSRFLAAASHDLRQPLSALSLYARVLEGHVDPAGAPFLAQLGECVGTLSALLTDLLDLSKLEAGVVRPNLADFAVTELFAAQQALHAPAAARKGLRLRCRPSTAMVRTDPVLYRRIVGNLIHNAIRYTERGGVLVACRRRAGKLWVEVWDTGIGIAPDKTEEIFEEFCQLGDAARTRGSVLGLAIVAKSAALLGLELRVRSRPGRGSLFAIELPSGSGAAAVPAAPAVVPARALRIALVEDNALLRAALTSALQELGHQVVEAEGGAALRTALAGGAPDALICDYRLGRGETGYDVIEALRATFGAGLPAILVTGDTDPSLVRSMAEHGIGVLHKPLDLETLRAWIGRLPRAGPPCSA